MHSFFQLTLIRFGAFSHARSTEPVARDLSAAF